MRDVLQYGGPDDSGIYVDANKSLAFGHRRLSILDLSELGHQPMSDEEGRFWITYNGEVYNFGEIREDLLSRGYRFRSQTDTEVILKAYREWGLDAVHKFRGMFAFALWDRNKEQLILCRDRAGVKPLYWYKDGGLFLFASELKAFHRHPGFRKKLNMAALSSFLKYGYITAPDAIYNNTYKLEPGHFLIVNKNLKIQIIKYWDIQDYYQKGVELGLNGSWRNKVMDDVADELEAVMRESFKLRMIADVPVGILLSGGIDSTTMVSLLAREGYNLKTFTIGFHEENYNEAVASAKVARYFGTDHTELFCGPNDAFNVILKLPDLYDEPIGDMSAIPTHLVSVLTRQKVTAALSGDGADELFCGYSKYWTLGKKVNWLKKLPLVDAINENIAFAFYKLIYPEKMDFSDKYSKFKKMMNADPVVMYDIASSFFSEAELSKIGIEPNPFRAMTNGIDLDSLHRMMLTDFKTYLPDSILFKVDRASMQVALELREPFLDNKLIEYVASMPLCYKYKRGISKAIIKKIISKYVPRELVAQRKKGFNVPVHQWFKKELTHLLNDYLSQEKIKKEGLFDYREVSRLVNDYLANRNVGANKVWLLLMFEMWQNKWCMS